MKFLERVGVMVRMEEPAFVLFHDPAIPAEAVCASVVQHLANQRATVARLRSDHISTDEGTFIRDALIGGRVLLLIAPDCKELPAALLKAWGKFREDPQQFGLRGGPGIRFEPSDSERQLGTLGLILPNDYAGRRPEARVTLRLERADELGGPAPPLEETRTLGRASVSLSMKALCFLHHRDSEDAQHHDSISEIMQGRGPLTWRDLQRVLQQQADRPMLDILEGFGAQGRVTTEQLDIAAEAIAFLREARREDERLGGHGLAPSIYHLLWIYGFLEPQGRVFRGQRNSRWRQDSTLLRPEPNGSPATIGTIVERLHRTQAFLDALAARERQLIGRALDEEERLAIAQHYGMPTPLLDYTRSLAVAAFFATGAGDPAPLRAGDVGLIYYVAPNDPVAAATPATAGTLDWSSVLGLRIGRMRTIEPQLPEAENRIARQRALFVEGFDSRDLQRLSLGVLYFRQQPGEAFEDPRLGITRRQLLAPDAGLQQLADSITPRPSKLSSRLTATPLPSDDLFGTLGLSLPANLRTGQRFLDQLASGAERVEAGFWPALKAILERHLDEARVKARTADVSAPTQLATERGPGGINHVLDEVDASLLELASLVGLEGDAFARPLRTHRPVLGPDRRHASVAELDSLRSTTPKVRIGLAAGLFIVALEYLRTVRGKLAEQYVQDATSELDGALQAFDPGSRLQ